MSLIVEDGTGLPTAESYISVANADAYLAGVGETAWAVYDVAEVKEPALRNATEYLGQVYRTRWQGSRSSLDQMLDWPRSGVAKRDGYGGTYEANIVPVEVQRACAKLALKAAAAKAAGSSLAPDIGRLASREKVGPLEVQYAEGGVAYTRYREVDMLLEPFLSGGGSICVLLQRQ